MRLINTYWNYRSLDPPVRERLFDHLLGSARRQDHRQIEYWPDPFEAASWRAEWVERIERPP